MDKSDPFLRWVANTIVALGGNEALYWQGLQCKWALTSDVDGMNACQACFDSKEQALARFSGLFADQSTVFH